LEQLSVRGDVAIGLLTGNVREAARRKLEHYKLWQWFPFGGFGDEHTDRNDIAAAALVAGRKHLNGNGAADPVQLVVIGDTLNDIRCARSIGARCVAVPTGRTSTETLRGGNPDVLVDTLEDSAAIMALFDE
jgi:phosphoglycolate phosphatase